MATSFDEIGVCATRQTGLRLIIAYKLVKAAGEVGAAVLIAALVAAGLASDLHAIAEQLRRHVVHAWSIWVANLLLRALGARSLELVSAALWLDGAFSFLEGWALHRRWWWGPWLVVVATGALVPFEIIALVRRVHVGRILLLAINLAIVVYLARRTYREHTASRRER